MNLETKVGFMEIDTKAINAQISRIETDYIEDCLPVVSTFSNVYDVGQKIFYNMTMSSEEIKKDYYCDHICNKKSLLRSITLMIPVLGQLAVFSYDRVIGRGNGDSLNNASPEQQNDEVYVLQFLKNPPQGVQKSAYKGNPLLNDETFMLKAVSLYGPKTLYYASDELKETPSFLLRAIQQRIHDTGKMPSYGHFSPEVLEGAFGPYSEKNLTSRKEYTIRNNIINASKGNDEMLLLADEFSLYSKSYIEDFKKRNAVYEETKSFWKQIAKEIPKAAENLLKNLRPADKTSIVYYELLKELENPQVFLSATDEQKRDIITLAEFFDESKILSFSKEQEVVVQQLKEKFQPAKGEHKLFSTEAAKIYGSMIETNSFKVPQNASEKVKEELQSYLAMANVKDLGMTHASIIKSNFIDDLDQLIKFLHSEVMDDELDYDTSGVPVEIQKIVNILPEFLDDDDSQLPNNLEKIKIVKKQVVVALNKLLNFQIRDSYNLLKTKNEPFLLQIFNVMDILKKIDKPLQLDK